MDITLLRDRHRYLNSRRQRKAVTVTGKAEQQKTGRLGPAVQMAHPEQYLQGPKPATLSMLNHGVRNNFLPLLETRGYLVVTLSSRRHWGQWPAFRSSASQNSFLCHRRVTFSRSLMLHILRDLEQCLYFMKFKKVNHLHVFR